MRPAEWVIVDDGSTDNTAELVEDFARSRPWIRLVRRTTENEVRAGGAKVVRAFLDGYARLATPAYDFIVKLDADLTLPSDYFESVARCFSEEPRVGLCGGYVVNLENGRQTREFTAAHHVRGAFKAYRRESYEAIGGVKPIWSWDGTDQMELMFRGWSTRVLPLAVLHHRPTGASYKVLPHRRETGREFYRNGYLLDMALAKALEFALWKPRGVGGAAFMAGYLSAWAHQEPKNVDPDLARFMRRFQYRRLLNWILPGVCGGAPKAIDHGSGDSTPLARDTGPRPGQYGIVTAVYNGAHSIAATAVALARQSMPPAFWIVVDDGSSDGTVGILEEQRCGRLAIDVVRRTRDTSDPFISKARALNLGLALAREKSCEFVGVLDADIVAAPDYFETLLGRMSADGRLGIAGGDVVPMVDGVRQYRRQKPDFSVAGAVQMFRRDCMNGLGWTCPEIVGGGEDAAMEILARSQGWKVRTFTDLPVMHDGPVGGCGWRRLRYLFMTGLSFRHLGYHPLFALARAVGRLGDLPPILGTLTEFSGYLWGIATVRRPSLDARTVAYLRAEQMDRLASIIRRVRPSRRISRGET